jgi:endogenous inhibitor of DNA gyrase (YacG/DUF329 family)
MARKYRCPFCNKTHERNKLAAHIEKYHNEMLDEDREYTSNRIVFDICNKKEPIGSGFGLCRICKKPTKWEEENVHYAAYCSDACKSEAREQYKKNMLRVHGKITLLDDINWQQEKMLANRGISGKYKWSDGTYKSYVGSYELKFLKFCDDVLHIKSEDLLTPGPTIEYEYNGKKHIWITDAIYLPYNLVFDIKDGGDNKNKREMPEYRNKQVQKEKFITDQGEYNYIRLTNNEFVQLLTIFAELRSMYLDPDFKTISRIHEHMSGAAIGGFPPDGATDINPNVFIINYSQKNIFDKKNTGFVLSNDIFSDYVLDIDDNGNIKKVKSKYKLNEDTICSIYKYNGDPSPILREVYYKYNNNIPVQKNYFALLVTEFTDILSEDQLQFSKLLEEVDLNKINEQYQSNIATLKYQLEGSKNSFPILDPVKYEFKQKILKEYKNIDILQLMDRSYFAINKDTMKRTKSVNSIYEITQTLLNSIK